ncbi:class I SAM-dependent methyltransferase [Streptomyces scopuliridis]|uniref:class I SAM-dependent methyltransferase n=1 Tax=Streptomyces scopuliridis TaxID=452529 RepID=UPI0036BD7EBC
MNYTDLVRGAAHAPFEGWDFGIFAGRFTEEKPPWDFAELVRARLADGNALLDLGTDGGEFLSGLTPLPPGTTATESYPPHVPVARRRLAPLGVRVIDTSDEDDDLLPLPDAAFGLVTSRHESYAPAEIARVLRGGGVFLTQQVGGRDLAELNEALGAPGHVYGHWDLATARAGLAGAGFEILDAREALVPAAFHDIGAVLLFLRITPWQIPDFDAGRYDTRLRALHARLSSGRPLTVRCHRFVITARRPLMS